jgi:hypothetical protein
MREKHPNVLVWCNRNGALLPSLLTLVLSSQEERRYPLAPLAGVGVRGTILT